MDAYPIPSTIDQLAMLAGGEKFSKLDLSQAYQQLELDEASRELLTINTHQGLYQPSRLQFGVPQECFNAKWTIGCAEFLW